jgi:hypothetical protein
MVMALAQTSACSGGGGTNDGSTSDAVSADSTSSDATTTDTVATDTSSGDTATSDTTTTDTGPSGPNCMGYCMAITANCTGPLARRATRWVTRSGAASITQASQPRCRRFTALTRVREETGSAE